MKSLVNLLVNDPGTPLADSLFHVPLFLSILIASLVVSLVSKKHHSIYSKRVFLALDFLLGGQFIIIILHGLNWLYLLPVNFFLPPLDRAIIVFSYLWIIWMWTSIFPDKRWDWLLALSNLAVLGLFIYSINSWSMVWKFSSFNLSVQDRTWQFLSISVLAAGILFVVLNRHKRWGIGLLFLLINLAGHLYHLSAGNSQSDYPQEVRLAQLLSFPLLIFIAARFQKKARTATTVQALPSSQINQSSNDPEAALAWIETAALHSDRVEVSSQIPEAIARAMQADVCLLAEVPTEEEGKFNLQGYDRVHNCRIPAREIESKFFPNIASAIMSCEAVNISTAGSPPVDAYVLPQILGFDQNSDILTTPVSVHGQCWGSLIILSPFTLRSWSEEEQSLYHEIGRKVGEILTRALKIEMGTQDSQFQQSSDQAPSDNTPSVFDQIPTNSSDPELILALQEITRLRSELRAARDRLMILELDSAITEQGDEPGPTDAWQSEIGQWIKSEETEPSLPLQENPPIPFDMNEMISRAIDGLQSKIAERNLTLQVNLEEIDLSTNPNREKVESLVTGLVNHIVNITPSNGRIRITTQPAMLDNQKAAKMDLYGMISDEPGTMEDQTGDPDLDGEDHPQALELDKLENMKEIAESLNGRISIEADNRNHTVIKVCLPCGSLSTDQV